MICGTPYCFTLDEDEMLSARIIQAVASIINAGRGELEPIQSVMDPAVLDSIPDASREVSLSFEYEGFHISIQNKRTVIIRDPESIHVDLNDATNVLLIAPTSNGDELCTELLVPYPANRENILIIAPESEINKRLDIWNEFIDQEPKNRKLITFRDDGEMNREPTRHDFGPDNGDKKPNRQAVVRLGKRTEKAMREFHTNSNPTAVCFRSINGLLGYLDIESTFHFLNRLTSAINATDTIAHYHIDPLESDRSIITTLIPIFDAVIYEDRNITFSL